MNSNNGPLTTIEHDVQPQLPASPDDSGQSSSAMLSRSDLIHALNVLFPGLQLVCDSNAMPVLDGSFSMFSESPQQLRTIFSSARKYRAEVAGDFATRKQRLQRLIEDVIQREASAVAVQQAAEPAKMAPPNGGCGAGCAAGSANVAHRLDKDYVRFVDELTEATAAAAGGGAPPPIDGCGGSDCSADFRCVEALIEHLARASDEGMKTKRIAPFNSNLPVLNISECSAAHTTTTSASNPAAVRLQILPTPTVVGVTTKPKTPKTASSSTATSSAVGETAISETTVVASSSFTANKTASAASALTKSSFEMTSKKRPPTTGSQATTTKKASKGNSGVVVRGNASKREQRSKKNDRFSPVEQQLFDYQQAATNKPATRMTTMIPHSSTNADRSGVRSLNAETSWSSFSTAATPVHQEPHQNDSSADPPAPDDVGECCNKLPTQQIRDYNVQMLQRQVLENDRLRRWGVEQQREQTTAMWHNRLADNRLSNVVVAGCAAAVVASATTTKDAPFFEELELQAMQQYRHSDESLERQFQRLELEAQSQYSFDK